MDLRANQSGQKWMKMNCIGCCGMQNLKSHPHLRLNWVLWFVEHEISPSLKEPKMDKNKLNWVLWSVEPEISPSLKNQD